jgi:hypothetical protein
MLVAALHVTEAYPNLGNILVNHLNSIPATARKNAFIPHLRDKTWAAAMLATWAEDSSTPDTTIKSIQAIKVAKGK